MKLPMPWRGGRTNNDMKKITIIFSVLVLGIMLFSAFPVGAQNTYNGPLGPIIPNCDPSISPAAGGCGLAKFLELIRNVIKFLVRFTLIVAPIFIALGGFMMLVSAGNKSLFDQGKSMMIGALVGIAIALLSYILISLIFTIFQIPVPGKQEEFDVRTSMRFYNFLKIFV